MDKITLKLVKYRDAGLPTYTYFWVNEAGQVMSPYFESDEIAKNWLSELFENAKNK
jgi:hypothetical protein